MGVMSFLGLFKRRVVHVEVQKNQAAAQPGEKELLARYTIANQPIVFPFDTPKPLLYSRAIRKNIKERFSWPSRMFLVIKIWREDGVDESPSGERILTRILASIMFVLTAIIALGALHFFKLALQETLSAPSASTVPFSDEDDFNPGVQAVLFGNVSVASATAAAIILVRVLRFSEPFETSLGWLSAHLGPAVLAILFNLALIAGWFGWETAAIKAMLAPWALVVSIIGAVLTAVFSTLRWTAIEEIQRKEWRSRWVADLLYRRKAV